MIGVNTNAMTRISVSVEAPVAASAVMATITSGSARIASTIRDRMSSAHPRK